MIFADYTVQDKELKFNSIQLSPSLLLEFNSSTIGRIREDDRRLLIGQMIVNNQGRVVSFNPQFISIWKLTPYVVTARCERQVFQFIAKQLENPQGFLIDIRNFHEQRSEIKDVVKLRDGRSFLQKMEPQWFENTVVGKIYQFRSLL